MSRLFAPNPISRSASVPVIPSQKRTKKKWDLEYRTQPVYSEQLPDDLPNKLRETHLQLQAALMKIEKLEESNSALKTDLKLAREILRGQVGTNESLIKLPHSTRIGQFFRWLGQIPQSWSTIIWQKSRSWSFFGVVFIVLLYVVWRVLYKSVAPTTNKKSTPKPPSGDTRFTMGSIFSGFVSLLLE